MDPFTFPAGLSIAPNESIILVENLTPAEFRLWWGTQNIPPSTRIISYGGSGLGLGAGGDGLRLWNSATTDLADTVASVDFGAADLGISFNFDPVTRQFGMKSVLGVNGVFRAASGTDIGSPGRIVAPATSPVLALGLTNETLRVSFDTMVGHRYSLQARDALGPEEWTFMGDTLTATNNARRYFDKSISGGSRFYRVLVD
jgi:hypothetical protein